MSVHKTMNTLLIQHLTKALHSTKCHFFFLIISQRRIVITRLNSFDIKSTWEGE
jgi:hypothetical protein